MYIQVSIDLQNYHKKELDLRLSSRSTVKRLIDIVWQVSQLDTPPRDGDWVRVVNKQMVCAGNVTLEESGITSGDKLEIL
ncbi:EsaB/YukD family protein [Halobacillus naozhouensis]|uniref:EsaB/YukD family protein n=1 Tax=Halobacillus naozhouensis TaxID=554880 RepID=A0ABY8IUX3_9BACI|nr:EsaB/YukD family protein [Halobacillus naozhouensis]WFT73938.1 EsaB/YukD family protein [Halobacillus naozhouensis]